MQEMKPVKEGKVREIYDNGDSLIMVATDRISCFDVILKKRIEKAKVYMETTDKKIYEISQSVGFDDTGYFSRIFKRYTGVSPKEYQSGKRGGDEE